MTDSADSFGGTTSHAVLMDELSDWLMDQAIVESNLTDLFEGCNKRLYAAGIPVSRSLIGYSTLHPLYQSRTILWNRGSGAVPSPHVHRDTPNPDWLNSPLYYMINNRVFFMRRRLTGPDAILDFPLLSELRELGHSDYLGYCIQFDHDINNQNVGSGVIGSWVSDRPGGFSDSDMHALRRVERQLAVAAKVRIKDEVASNILSAYLGPDAGQKVLDGQIKLGDGEMIPAIIWYSDLRKSTHLAEQLGPQRFLELLNRYFECTAGAVLDNGGEVLRFVGDAVLAIFPLRSKRSVRRAGRRLVDAIHESNRRKQQLRKDGWPIDFGIGVHSGEVLYGNIGVPSRLEFSVIGTTANEVARIEDLTKKAKCPVLISSELEKLLECELHKVGSFSARGVGRNIDVYTLPELAPAARRKKG